MNQEINQEMTIDLREYLNLLKKWWWIPMALALVFSVVSAVYCYFFAHKIYEANTSLYVISKDTQDNTKMAYSDLQIGGLLIKDYKELVKQRAISKEVITELKLDSTMEVASLIDNIKVEAKNDTRILQISISDPDPKLAAILADKVAEVFTRKVVQTMNVENVQIIDKAEIPLIPISPKPKVTIIIALFLGAALGIGIIMLIEYLDDTLKVPDDIRKVLDWNTMSTMPLVEKEGNTQDESKRDNIVTLDDPKSTVSEQYRVLRTSIQFKAVDQELKKILVTSSGTGEGKSTILVNLAVVLAQSDVKVLIIDADLRKATIHKFFKLNATKGLTVCLPKKGNPLDYVQKTDIKGLDVVTSGPVPPDPSELLGSKSMKDFVEKVSEKYDYVLIDSPPVGIVTDAAVMSRVCDGVIFVVSSGTTKIETASEAKEELAKVDANVLGVVLNKVKRKRQEYYYYYYGKDEDRGES